MTERRIPFTRELFEALVDCLQIDDARKDRVKCEQWQRMRAFAPPAVTHDDLVTVADYLAFFAEADIVPDAVLRDLEEHHAGR